MDRRRRPGCEMRHTCEMSDVFGVESVTGPTGGPVGGWLCTFWSWRGGAARFWCEVSEQTPPTRLLAHQKAENMRALSTGEPAARVVLLNAWALDAELADQLRDVTDQ
jgi:hypothetical protein